MSEKLRTRSAAKMMSTRRLTRKSGSAADEADSKKPTSSGVTSAVNTRHSVVAASHHPIIFEERGSTTQLDLISLRRFRKASTCRLIDAFRMVVLSRLRGLPAGCGVTNCDSAALLQPFRRCGEEPPSARVRRPPRLGGFQMLGDLLFSDVVSSVET